MGPSHRHQFDHHDCSCCCCSPGKQSPAPWHRVPTMAWGCKGGQSKSQLHISTKVTSPDETSNPVYHSFGGETGQMSITHSIQAISGLSAEKNHLAPTQLCFGSTEQSLAIRGKEPAIRPTALKAFMLSALSRKQSSHQHFQAHWRH